MNDLVTLLKTNNVTVTLNPDGKIRCVKGYKFPDNIERLIYRNYDVQCNDVGSIIYCIKEFMNFYNDVINKIKEEGFNVEDLT